MGDDDLTRHTLLNRLKSAPGDADWEALYAQYWSTIFNFARRRGLDEYAARDVLQETMILLMRKLPDFTYDPARGRFRNWLLSLVAGKVGDAFKRAARNSLMVSIHAEQPGTQEKLEDTLAADSSGASDDLEQTWMQSLVEEALRRLQDDPQIKPGTIEVFQAYAMENRPVAEVARRFGLAENAVYQIKNRLLKRLREEVAGLELSTSL